MGVGIVVGVGVIVASGVGIILAVGSIYKAPKENDGKIKFVNIIKSTLSVDHRAVDGADAAKMLKDFHDIIENPFDLWLQSKDMEII